MGKTKTKKQSDQDTLAEVTLEMASREWTRLHKTNPDSRAVYLPPDAGQLITASTVQLQSIYDHDVAQCEAG